MSINKDSVMALREKTGAGLIDCKRALGESNGDMEEAVSILRKKGVATAAKKSGRSASEGMIAQAISEDRSKGILVEVNCETDFVAKNDDFVDFSNEIANELLSSPTADFEEKRTEQVAKIGENIKISRSETLAPETSGLVESYVHTGAKVAVLLSVGSDSSEVHSNELVVSMAKDICMHIAATSPVCVSRDEVPSELVDKEKEIAQAQAEGKPPQAVEKIISGKLEKYFAGVSLLEQPFVKNPDQSIQQFVDEVGKEIGSQLKVEKFLRFQVGDNS
ncbi:translation elongation factor Ts [Opitutales bacterium]|nr:translation elongation factor Ts [Opitutales bacterium]MDB3958142.1 translation elongation factor Ts [Opitutales bacterium]